MQVYVERGLRSAEMDPAWEMAAFEEVLSLSLADRRVLLEEAVAVGSESQQYFASSQQRGPEELEHAGEGRLGAPRHPIVVQVEPQRHSGKLVGERLVARGRCAG